MKLQHETFSRALTLNKIQLRKFENPTPSDFNEKNSENKKRNK